MPDVRVAVVRRSVDEVVESFMRLGRFDRDRLVPMMRRLDSKLDQIEARWPAVLSLRFDDLEREETCARLFEFCLPHRHNHAWWSALAPRNVQINMEALLRYYTVYEPQLTKLTKIAKQMSLALMATRPAGELEGITIQQETFETFYRDGRALFADHLVQVGEAPDNHAAKNIPMMAVLDGLGAMHIMTARCNGRMFGYLMSVLSPSMERRDVMTAIQTTFYASQEFRGLGMKLQRESVASLRALGVGEIYMRAGTRGDGPRMGTLYKRLGAAETGQLYMIDLKDD